MFLLTLAALVAAVEGVIGGTRHALPGGLAVIVVLACVTIARRLIRLARALHAR